MKLGTVPDSVCVVYFVMIWGLILVLLLLVLQLAGIGGDGRYCFNDNDIKRVHVCHQAEDKHGQPAVLNHLTSSKYKCCWDDGTLVLLVMVMLVAWLVVVVGMVVKDEFYTRLTTNNKHRTYINNQLNTDTSKTCLCCWYVFISLLKHPPP